MSSEEMIMPVSVVIPAFNAEKTIVKALLSALSQEDVNVECIIVDDCSSDLTPKLVREITEKDNRVKYYCMPLNSGSPAGPRNLGIRMASNRYIAFLDADDEWLPGKLVNQIDFMEKLNAAVSCTGYRVVNASGGLIGAFHPRGITSYQSLLRHNTVGCSTVVIDTNKVGKPEFPVCGHEDYALWLDLARHGFDIHGLTDELGVYRVAEGSVSSNKLKVLSYFWNIYRNIEGFSVSRSALYCLRYAWNVRNKYG